MRLTRAVDYAVHAVVAMASNPKEGNGPVASHLTAQAQGIPERFLLKVLKPLVSAGILRSIKGPNGGYHLAKPTKTITLLDVVEAVEGPLHGRTPFASGKLDHRLATVFEEATETVRRHLGKVSLADLAARRK